MTVLATQTIEKTKPLTILQRIEREDRTVIKDCVETYGNLVWALARKFTRSPEEAEAAAQEIFMDIWRYAERSDPQPESAENLLIAAIARRRLIEYLK